MPRPATIPASYVESCEEAFAETDALPEVLKGGENRPFFLELWISGSWLRDTLLEHECPEALSGQICFAHGQLSMGRDPWDVVDYLLEAYGKGLYPEPGEQLALESMAGAQVSLSEVDRWVPPKEDRDGE
jgi:hypothetical protein